MNGWTLSRYGIGIVIGMALWASAAARASELSVLLRYDDYSTYTPGHMEEQLFEVAKAVQGSVLVGIVPFPETDYPPENQSVPSPATVALSEEKRSLIDKYHKQGVVSYALHGYSHKDNASSGDSSAGGRQSEFAVLSPERQKMLLSLGKKVLEKELSAPVDIFIPPFNSYDRNTLTALKENGFTLISAAIDGEVTSELAFLPAAKLYPQELRDKALKALSRNEQGIIVVTIHPYDFVESQRKFPEFRRGTGAPMSIAQFRDDIQQLRKQGVEFASVEALNAKGEDLSAERLMANRRLRQNFVADHALIPDRLIPLSMEDVYYASDDADARYRIQISAAIALYGFLLIVCIAVARRLWRYLAKYPWLVSTGVLGLVAAIAFIGYHAYTVGFHFKASLVSTVLAGALLGLGNPLNLRRHAAKGKNMAIESV